VARRRARRRAVLIEHFTHREIFERDCWICQICKQKTNPEADRFDPLYPNLDHVIPLSEGGPHTRANTRCTCFRCNCSRGNRGGNEQLALI
jgi:5-methylcytosine-specific restriction endonuclease McrA